MIQTQEVSITYQGDGVQTSFTYPYAYRSSEDIKGYLVNEEGYEEKITTNYRYDTVENKYIYPLQGEPLQAPWCIKLIRETPQQQNEKLPNKLPFSMIEKSLDWIIMILQEIGTRMNFLWHIRNDCKQSETNAKNSANAAAKSEENAANSEENAANSEDMAQKWAMSPTSPDGNTDENSPTGLTQSSKIWAALSREYAGMSKFKMPIAYYNSVAEMKASETALVGRPCVTLGYYEPNDGGGSVYIIRAKKENDTDDDGSIITLDNGNMAEILVGEDVNVRQFGAKGDAIHDDSDAIQKCIDYAYRNGRTDSIDEKIVVKIIFPLGTYLVSKTLAFNKELCSLTLDIANATIKYVGDSFAFLFKYLRNSHLNLGNIIAENGSGVHFLAEGERSEDCMMYVHVTWNCIKCKETGILGECSNPYPTVSSSTLWPWLNAMYFYGGRFENAKIGIHAKAENAGNVKYWVFYGVSSETSEVGFKLENTTKDIYSLGSFSFFGCYFGDYTKHAVMTVGNVKRLLFVNTNSYTSQSIGENAQFNLSANTEDVVFIPEKQGTIRIKPGDDFNNFNTIGDYVVTSNKDMFSIQNAPKIDDSYKSECGRLKVRSLEQVYEHGYHWGLIQIFITYKANRIFKRYKTTGDTWSDWILVKKPVEYAYKNKKYILEDYDLNRDGEYIIQEIGDFVTQITLPEQVPGRLCNKSIGGDSRYVYQTYYTNNGKVWGRVYSFSNNKFTSWKLLLNFV